MEQAPHLRTHRLGLLATVGMLVVATALLAVGTLRYAREAVSIETQLRQQVALSERLWALQQVLALLHQASTGQHSPMATGQVADPAPTMDAVEQAAAALTRFEQAPDVVSGDLAVQQRQVAVLTRQALDRIARTTRQPGRRPPSQAVNPAEADEPLQHRAHGALQEAIGELKARRDAAAAGILASHERQGRIALWTVSALVVCSLLASTQVLLLVRAQRRQSRVLANGESRHRAMVEDQQELVSLARADGTLVYVNPAYARAFGLSEAQLLGRNLVELVSESDRVAVRQQMTEVFRTGQGVNSENRVRLVDGADHWFAWTNTVQHNERGESLLHSVGRDVTERRRAEEALRASEQFLARTGRVAGVGGWELDLATDVLLCSEEMRRLHGLADAHPTLGTFLAGYAEAPRQALVAAVEHSRHLGTAFDVELPLETGDGRTLWVRAVGEPEIGPDGLPVKLVGACQDVTTRKLLEEQLAASERFVRNITDSLEVRIAYVDADARYRFVNAAHVRRLGKSRQEVLGRRRSEVTGEALRPEDVARVQAALQGQAQRFEFDDQVDGQARIIQTQLLPDFGPSGEVRGLFVTGVDITELKSTERWLRDLTDILDHTPDFIVQTDHKGVVQYINPAARRSLGFSADEPAQTHTFTEFNTEETNQRYATEIMPAVLRDGVWVGESTVLASKGRVRQVSHMVIAHRDSQGRSVRFSAILRDIAQTLAARRALQEKTATLVAVVESIPAMVGVLDSALHYTLVNGAFERWQGKPRDAIVGRPASEVLGAEDHARSLPWAERALAGETVNVEKEYPGAHRHRHVNESYIPLRTPEGEVSGLVVVSQDITLHRDEERRLLNLAERDALTGVLNRAGLANYLAQTDPFTRGHQVALLYIDLDRFKPINDAHGHAVGDGLLKEFAQRLQSLVRPTDAVARLGGDEFAIVLNDVRIKEHADAVAEKVVAAALRPFIVAGRHLRVGASVGVAFCMDESQGWEELMKRADEAVYRAKAAGRGTWA
jgi:diguanylate cyclase (GGDEF)-like protein/PAS domain S-box-containing protein